LIRRRRVGAIESRSSDFGIGAVLSAALAPKRGQRPDPQEQPIKEAEEDGKRAPKNDPARSCGLVAIRYHCTSGFMTRGANAN